jgi:ribA/ribD-fused uncharacterized protein
MIERTNKEHTNMKLIGDLGLYTYEDMIFFSGGWPSNWYPSPITILGIRYNCVEQYMMAMKATVCGDDESLRKILETDNPSEQKRLGRLVKNYNEDTWADIRYRIVLKSTIQKYSQNRNLFQLLKLSKGLKFVEASPEDPVWGIGLGIEHPDALVPERWKGRNLLGNAIDEARLELIGY